MRKRKANWAVVVVVFTLFLSGPSALARAITEATPPSRAEPRWSQQPPIPQARSELGAAVIGSAIYVAGGFGGGSRVDRFDTQQGTWQRVADLPIAVHHPGVAALDGRLYVAGGYREDDHTAVADVWVYDPATDAWERRAALPVARGAFGLATLDGYLYAVGGALERLGGPATGSVERYDPRSDRWQARQPLPAPREHLAVVAGNGHLYAVGGRANGDESDRFAAAHEVYDPAADRWESLPPLPVPRGGLAGVFVNGWVIVLGGERGQHVFADVNAFDTATSRWTALPAMPAARHGLAAAVVGAILYAMTGSTVAGRVQNTDVVEAFALPPEIASV
jgi:N-acetylneuraminic acid mutarotase